MIKTTLSMIYMRNIHAKWESKHEAFLKKMGVVTQYGYINIPEDEFYFQIVEYLKDAPGFQDERRFIQFEPEEYLPFNKFMFTRGYDLAGQLVGFEDMSWKKEVFGDFCPLCFVPYEEQKNPFVFKREVTFSKKYLFFTMDAAHNYLFTDKERYEGDLKSWGLGYRGVLIGKSRKVSKNLVQLDIPVSPYNLNFADSAFGKTFDLKSGRIVDNFCVCPTCSRPLYSVRVADYFPAFEQDFDFNMVHTQEWFGGHHHIVVSRPFAEFLVARKIAKWDSSYFIPVKKFQPQ